MGKKYKQFDQRQTDRERTCSTVELTANIPKESGGFSPQTERSGHLKGQCHETEKRLRGGREEKNLVGGINYS
jgi:hypothetical protein